MRAEDVAVPFADAPGMEQVEAIINGWQKPRLPDKLEPLALNVGEGSPVELAHLVSRSLAEIQSLRHKAQLEVKLISWLYDFIRANVNRGRVFDLGEVLLQGSADCLGYAKLFTLLGRLFGLDTGIIEIVVDNAGRYVPHTAVLVRLSDGRLRAIDLWYGSKNIRHKRIGLQVKQGGAWRIEDVEMRGLSSQREKRYLPDSCVDAITLYIYGNRHLEKQEFDNAIKCYSEGICLYPGNARFFYNRAIAYENLGEYEKADADYGQALPDGAAMIRLLATEHDEVTSLLDLDAKGLDSLAQDMYLLHRGFATGKKVQLSTVARKFGLSEAKAKAVLSLAEAKLAVGSDQATERGKQ